MKKILTFLLLAVLLCIPLTTQAAVEDPAIIFEDPARPQYIIFEDPARPQYVIFEDPARPQYVIFEDPAKPQYKILEDPAIIL